ncbi:MAG: PAS domain-containing protein, partial [Chloroflexi bacterium]|nr:PAS domain-containing protein [Chloroflexota bacterium]
MLNNKQTAQGHVATVLNTKGLDYYHVMADVMPQIVYIACTDGAIDYMNQRWYEYTEANSLASLGFAWINHLHPDDHKRTFVRWQQSVCSGLPFEIEYRLRNAQGKYYWHLSRAQPISDEIGEITHWIGTATDIHSRKQAELALQTSEQRLQLAQKAGGIVSWEWNLETNEAFWSDGYATLFGYEPASTQAPNFADWLLHIHPEDRPQVQEIFQHTMQTGAEFNSKFRVVWPDGSTHWLMAQGKLISQTGGLQRL